MESDVFSRKGIQKVRVLSQSMLESLILKMVERRVETTLSSTPPAEAPGGLDASGLASIMDDEKRKLRELRSEFRNQWNRHRESRESQIEAVQSRVARLGQTFEAMERSLKELSERIAQGEQRAAEVAERAEPTVENAGPAGADPCALRPGRESIAPAGDVAHPRDPAASPLESAPVDPAPVADSGPQRQDAVDDDARRPIYVIGCRPASQ